MDKRLMVAAMLVSAMMLGFPASDSYAEHNGKSKEGCGRFEDKFFYKAGCILKSKDELGLSDRQITQIKELKINTKKDLIRKNAEIDILAIDIKQAIWQDPIDTDAVGKLIDKKYDLKKEKTKSVVKAYAALKGILTEEQKAKLKDLRKKDKKNGKCYLMKMMKCKMNR